MRIAVTITISRFVRPCPRWANRCILPAALASIAKPRSMNLPTLLRPLLLITLGVPSPVLTAAAKPGRRPNMLSVISDNLSARITPAGYRGTGGSI